LKRNAEAQAGLSEAWIYRQRGPQRRNRLGQPSPLQAEKSQIVMNQGVARRNACGLLQRENSLCWMPGVEALSRARQQLGHSHWISWPDGSMHVRVSSMLARQFNQRS
jgi:hypothetical protein